MILIVNGSGCQFNQRGMEEQNWGPANVCGVTARATNGDGVGLQSLGTFKGGERKHSIKFSGICNLHIVCVWARNITL